MEWVTQLRGQTVAIDTAPFIFYIEKNPDYFAIVRPFFESLAHGDFSAITSTITLLEVLVRPLRQDDEPLAHRYNDILITSPHLSTLPVMPCTAQLAAELRAEHSLKVPDAIQLAIAIENGATYLVTNDRDIPCVGSVKVIRLFDLITP